MEKRRYKAMGLNYKATPTEVNLVANNELQSRDGLNKLWKAQGEAVSKVAERFVMNREDEAYFDLKKYERNMIGTLRAKANDVKIYNDPEAKALYDAEFDKAISDYERMIADAPMGINKMQETQDQLNAQVEAINSMRQASQITADNRRQIAKLTAEYGSLGDEMSNILEQEAIPWAEKTQMMDTLWGRSTDILEMLDKMGVDQGRLQDLGSETAIRKWTAYDIGYKLHNIETNPLNLNNPEREVRELKKLLKEYPDKKVTEITTDLAGDSEHRAQSIMEQVVHQELRKVRDKINAVKDKIGRLSSGSKKLTKETYDHRGLLKALSESDWYKIYELTFGDTPPEELSKLITPILLNAGGIDTEKATSFFDGYGFAIAPDYMVDNVKAEIDAQGIDSGVKMMVSYAHEFGDDVNSPKVQMFLKQMSEHTGINMFTLAHSMVDFEGSAMFREDAGVLIQANTYEKSLSDWRLAWEKADDMKDRQQREEKKRNLLLEARENGLAVAEVYKDGGGLLTDGVIKKGIKQNDKIYDWEVESDRLDGWAGSPNVTPTTNKGHVDSSEIFRSGGSLTLGNKPMDTPESLATLSVSDAMLIYDEFIDVNVDNIDWIRGVSDPIKGLLGVDKDGFPVSNNYTLDAEGNRIIKENTKGDNALLFQGIYNTALESDYGVREDLENIVMSLVGAKPDGGTYTLQEIPADKWQQAKRIHIQKLFGLGFANGVQPEDVKLTRLDSTPFSSMSRQRIREANAHIDLLNELELQRASGTHLLNAFGEVYSEEQFGAEADKRNEKAREIMGYVNKHAGEYDVNKLVAMAQWARETGHGMSNSRPSTELNNLFGLTNNGGFQTEYEVVPMYVEMDGAVMNYIKFPSREASVEYYLATMERMGYNDLNNLHNYATDPNYVKEVITSAITRFGHLAPKGSAELQELIMFYRQNYGEIPNYGFGKVINEGGY